MCLNGLLWRIAAKGRVIWNLVSLSLVCAVWMERHNRMFDSQEMGGGSMKKNYFLVSNLVGKEQELQPFPILWFFLGLVHSLWLDFSLRCFKEDTLSNVILTNLSFYQKRKNYNKREWQRGWIKISWGHVVSVGGLRRISWTCVCLWERKLMILWGVIYE